MDTHVSFDDCSNYRLHNRYEHMSVYLRIWLFWISHFIAYLCLSGMGRMDRNKNDIKKDRTSLRGLSTNVSYFAKIDN